MKRKQVIIVFQVCDCFSRDKRNIFAILPRSMGAGDSKDDTPVEYDSTGFAKVGPSTDFPASKLKKFKVAGYTIVVAQAPDGQFYALENKCAHFGGDLSGGQIVDIEGIACVKCPRHGITYDVRTGKAWEGAKVKQRSLCQRQFEVKHDNGFFWIKPPERDKK